MVVVRRGLMVPAAVALTLLLGGCTDSTDSTASQTLTGPDPAASSTEEIPGGRDSAASASTGTGPPEVVKAADGPPWKIDGQRGVGAAVAAPEEFQAAGFDVPADHVALTLAFELENPQEVPYESGGFTAGLASSAPCEGFAYMSDGVTGVPEMVDAGDVAAFKYGYICKGESGDKLTLKVGLDPNSAITRIKTRIP